MSNVTVRPFLWKATLRASGRIFTVLKSFAAVTETVALPANANRAMPHSSVCSTCR